MANLTFAELQNRNHIISALGLVNVVSGSTPLYSSVLPPSEFLKLESLLTSVSFRLETVKDILYGLSPEYVDTEILDAIGKAECPEWAEKHL